MFNLTPRERLIKARVSLNNRVPFFGRLAMQLKFVEKTDGSCPTMGVYADGTCDYNPDFVNSITDAQLEGAVCHEIMHCALCHLSRMTGMNGNIANIAADLVDNDMLAQNNFELPEGVYLPDKNHTYVLKHKDGELEIKDINKRGFESIYHEIRNAIKDQNQDLGEGFDNHHAGDAGDKNDAYWKDKLVEAAMASKMAGKTPAGVDRIIDAITNPKMSWNQLLQRFIRKNIPYDFTWRRPSKKTYTTGVYLPQTEKTGVKITFLIDTSGSMSDDDVRRCFGEIIGVVRAVQGLELTVLFHDTEVYEGKTIVNPTERDIIMALKDIKGNGGTSFSTAYEYIEKNHKKSDVVIHLTDGEDSFPPTFTRPLIICLLPCGREVDAVEKECNYATIVKIPK